MNKKLLFSLFLLFIGIGNSWKTSAQELQIGATEDPANTSNAPIALWYKYSYSQIIYSKEELAPLSGKQITALSYRMTANCSPERNEPITIYIGSTEVENFDSDTQGWLPTESMKTVYDGEYSFSKEGWINIPLQTPFVYDGSSSLVITFSSPVQRGATPKALFYASKTDNKMGLLYKSDSSPLTDFSSLASIAREIWRPNTKFIYSGVPTTPVMKLVSHTLDFGMQAAQSGPVEQLLKILNVGKGELTANISGLSAPFSTQNPNITIAEQGTYNLPVFFTPEFEGDYSQEITLSGNGGEETVTLTGIAYPQDALYENFEQGGIPAYWRTTNGLWSEASNAFEGKKSIHIGSTADTLITPKIQGGKASFYLKFDNTYTKAFDLLYSQDLKSWTRVEIAPPTESYQKYELNNLPENSFIAFAGKNVFLDLVLINQPIYPSKDLYLSYLSIPSGLKENTEIDVTVKVKNWGKQAEDSYRIILKNENEDIVADQTFSTSIEPLAEETLEIRWNPSPESKKIVAEVVLANDEDATNNCSNSQNIEVTPYIAILKIATSKLDFDLLMEAAETVSLPVTLRNTGIAPLTISSLQVTEPFTTNLTTPITLEAGGTQTLEVSFGNYQPGNYEDTLKVVHNGQGDAEIVLKGSIYRPGDLFESFEGAEFPPLMWRQTTGKWKLKTPSTHGYKSGACAYQDSRTVMDTLITPKLKVTEGEKLSFYAKNWNNSNAELNVIYSPDMINWTYLLRLKDSDGTLNKTTITYTECTLPPGEYFIGFEGRDEAIIDYVRGPQVIYADNDLQLVSLTLPNMGNVNGDVTATVRVKNLGNLNTENYTVKLMSGEEVLAEAPGIAIGKLEEKEIQFIWIPQKSKVYSVSACITFEADQDKSNNQSANTSIDIKPETYSVVNLGTLNSQGSTIPITTNYKYTMSETIYPASLITIPANSVIKSITYPYLNSSSAHTLPVRIWAGTTDKSEFSNEDASSWIHPSELTLVYEGTFEVLSKYQTAEVTFTLSTPISYDGRNLVILFERTWSNLYKSFNFYTNTFEDLHMGTAVYRQDPEISYDPATPITLLPTAKNEYPTVYFEIEKPKALVSGTVVDENEMPLTGASILMESGQVKYTTLTDAQGAFEIAIGRLNKTYTLTIQKEGYKEKKPISIEVGNTPIDLGILKLVNVNTKEYFDLTLHVSTIIGESVEGTQVHLEHNLSGLTFEGVVPQSGEITFEHVYEGEYTLTLQKSGMARYIDNALEMNENKTLEIVIQEIILQPYGLQAPVSYSSETGKADVCFNWNNQVSSFFDNFESYPDYSINFAPWSGYDGDKFPTLRPNVAFDNAGLPQYGIIFNPLYTDPSLWSDLTIRPYSGKKFLGIFSAFGGATNDWVISPKQTIHVNDEVSFMVKGWGNKERYRVGISTTGTAPEDFTIISSGNYLEAAPGEWKKVSFNLSAYEGKEIYVAINGVSNETTILMIDDFYIGASQKALQKEQRAQRASANLQTEVKANVEYVVYIDHVEVSRQDSTSYSIPNMVPGAHTLGVKSVYKSGESPISQISIEVEDLAQTAVKVSLNVSTNAKEPADGAVFTLTNADNEYRKEVQGSKIELNYVRKGEYQLSIVKEGFVSIQESISLQQPLSNNYELKEKIEDPYNLVVDIVDNAQTEKREAHFMWNLDLGWSDNFESYADFTQDLSPWTTIDNDMNKTFGLNNGTAPIQFPGTQEEMAAVIFNPGKTTPVMKGDGYSDAIEGEKYVAFFTSDISPSDDWLISPQQQINAGYKLVFDAKSYSDLYGEERVRICISTTGQQPENFTTLDELSIPAEWTEYEVDLSDYAGKKVYIAFNYVSFNTFFMMLDQVYIGPEQKNSSNSGRVRSFDIYLNNARVATGVTDTKYIFKDLKTGTYTAGVKAIYASGASEVKSTTFSIVQIGIENQKAAFSIYPTPIVNGTVTIESSSPMQSIRFLTIDGKFVSEFNGEEAYSKTCHIEQLPTGFYLIEIQTAREKMVRKVLVE